MRRTAPITLLISLFLAGLSACVQDIPVLLAPPDAGDPDDSDLVGEPFGEPVGLLDGVDPYLSQDELELFYNEGGELKRALRDSRDGVFGPGEPIAGLDSDEAETDPMLFDGDLAMVFASFRTGDAELYITRRDSTDPDSPWSAPVWLAELGGPTPECCGVMNGAATVILFSTYRDGPSNIYRAERASAADAFGTPTLAGTVSDEQANDLPSQWRDGLLVMDSDRLGRGRDIFLARYSDAGEGGTPQPVASVNAAGNDRNGWLSRDGKRLYFQSDRDGVERIYVAER